MGDLEVHVTYCFSMANFLSQCHSGQSPFLREHFRPCRTGHARWAVTPWSSSPQSIVGKRCSIGLTLVSPKISWRIAATGGRFSPAFTTKGTDTRSTRCNDARTDPVAGPNDARTDPVAALTPSLRTPSLRRWLTPPLARRCNPRRRGQPKRPGDPADFRLRGHGGPVRRPDSGAGSAAAPGPGAPRRRYRPRRPARCDRVAPGRSPGSRLRCGRPAAREDNHPCARRRAVSGLLLAKPRRQQLHALSLVRSPPVDTTRGRSPIRRRSGPWIDRRRYFGTSTTWFFRRSTDQRHRSAASKSSHIAVLRWTA
jgi:hypothetical protein